MLYKLPYLKAAFSMNRFASFLLFLLLLVTRGSSYAEEPDPPRQLESDSKFQPYVRCDGFAEGVRGVTLDRRPQTAEPWREVGFGGKSQRISAIDGYRVMYSYARTYPFAKLKAEQSDPSKYLEDKEIVTSYFADMAKADGKSDLVNFSGQGFSGQTLTKKELTGTTLGITQVLWDEDSIIVTIYFLNQAPENRRFKTYEEFISLRDSFISGYIECVTKKRSTPILSQ
ncbi:MAG TPA: hypothetical protein VNN78_04850 [Burkholderiales bacterium]|nr:hypothetical protein [Burkholderiales bacterium]